MKLSKTALIFLASGIFIVVVAIALMTYLEQDEERSRLSQELSAAQLLLSKQSAKLSPEEFSSQKKELESHLAQVELYLDTAKTELRQSIESDEVANTLLEVAQTCGVEIIEMYSGMTSDNLRGVSFATLSLTVTIKGDVSNQIDFLFELSQQLPTSVDSLIEINVEAQSATCTLRVYAYED